LLVSIIFVIFVYTKKMRTKEESLEEHLLHKEFIKEKKSNKHKKKEKIKTFFNNCKPGTKEYRRRNLLRYYFNITLEEYNKLLESQNYSCSICKRHMSTFKKNLGVDHCHKTGVIRGILCNNCNNGLGNFKDNIDFLKEAITYLDKKY